MKLIIHGRNLELTPALREYTQSKLKKAIQHFEDMVKEADVHLSVARNPRSPQQTAEVTVFANGTVIRAQERSENLYASIDLVASKLCRQLRRYKERHSDYHHSDGHSASLTQSTESVLNPLSRSGSCYIYMAVEGANQCIFLKQLRFIIYMRLGDTVYQP